MINYRVTTYSPQRGGDRMEGGYESSRPGPDGVNMVRTLEDYRNGASPYVTVAGNPALYGRQYIMPEVAYNVGGQRYVLNNVPVVVHDTGSAFRNAPEGRFDVPVSRDLGPADTNQGLSGVQFVPTQMAFAGNANGQPAPGIQAINAATSGKKVANFFDQFDAPSPAQSGQGGGNFFDQFDAPATGPSGKPTFDMGMPATKDAPAVQPEKAPPSGIWNNLTAGLNSAIYSTLGAPVDAATWVLNKAADQARVISGAPVQEIKNPVGGSQSIAGAMESVGVNDPAKVQANNIPEQTARAAGTGAGYMVAPEAIIGALGKAGVLSESVLNALAPIFGRSASVGDVASGAAVGAAGGVAGDRAASVVPEPYKPLAEIAGNLVGSAAGVGAIAGARGVANLPQAVRDFRLSTPASQESAAGRIIQDAASDPIALRTSLENAPGELVPGSKPTTFQLTGDMGIGGLERGAQTVTPEPFQVRRGEQNAARVQTVQGLQAKGAPEAVVSTLKQGLADIEAATARAVEEATTTAQAATNAMGGRGTPEGYGSAARDALRSAEAVARERERSLWAAVDPDNTLALPATETRKAARQIIKEMPQAAKPMEGEERDIFIAAARLPGVSPFREVTALRSRISTEMRRELRENGQSPVYARLSRLRAQIEADIDGAVSAKAAQEADAVARGEMNPDATTEARIRGWTEGWYANRQAAEVGQGFAESAGGNASFGPASFSSSAGSAGQNGRGPRNPAGDQGVQSSGLQPNFDEAAAQRLKVASDATKERAQTFNQGPVGNSLAELGGRGNYKLPEAVVPEQFFKPGPGGYEAIQKFKAAAGDAAMPSLQDYALYRLRSAAERQDGTLDPAKVRAWQVRHADALRAFPDLEKIIADPVQASQAIEAAAVRRKAAIDQYESVAVSRLLNLESPEDVVRTVGAVFQRQDAARQMAMLRSKLKDDPAALEGLRKSIADYMMMRFISNTEVATSGVGGMKSDTFQNFLKQNTQALRRAGFSETEISSLKAVAADLQRANRSLVAVRIPGQSNTAQDLNAIGKPGAGRSWLTSLVNSGAFAAAGATVGGVAAGPLGAAVGAAGGARLAAVAQAMRKAGLESVDAIVRDALLNPERARALLAKVSAEPTRREALSLSHMYLRSSLQPGPEPSR